MISEPLQSEFNFSIDRISESDWSVALNTFADANFYQTWSYGKLNWNMGIPSHFVLEKKGNIVALAQLRIVRIPFIEKGIAYLARGPVWKLRNTKPDFEIFRMVIKLLYNKYVIEKGLLLRIRPNEIMDGNDALHKILCDEGFSKKTFPPDRTLLIDLTPSIDELRQNLVRKWRQALARAERLSSLNLDCGTTNEHYQIALDIYREMHGRKQFAEFVDMEKHRLAQQDLPDFLKMKIMICRLNDEPIAALGWSTIGETGLPLIAATGNKSIALSTNASNLLWWKMIENMKTQGCKFCDVGGIDPILNPGGYKFKSGLVGKNGRDVFFLNPYEACNDPASSFLVNIGEQIRHRSQKFKIKLRNKNNDPKEADTSVIDNS
ncbi:MAG: GNAT family N-acetyltransferase [Deltaproteobacteria bacterium]|nr:GNAT family N-acetyltransferase [Deltaproteobacteria bacterium]